MKRHVYEVIETIVEFFAALWRADERPQARRAVLGCGAVVVLLVVAGAIIWRWW